MFDGELRQLAAGLTDLKGLSDTGDCAGVRRLQAPREFRARRIRTKGVPEVGVSSVRQKDSPNGNVDSSAERADRTRVQPAGVESTKISVLNSAWHCASLSKLKRCRHRPGAVPFEASRPGGKDFGCFPCGPRHAARSETGIALSFSVALSMPANARCQSSGPPRMASLPGATDLVALHSATAPCDPPL